MADIISDDDTDDGIYSTKKAFKQPVAGETLKWFSCREPELYYAFMAKLVGRQGSIIKVHLLDRVTGEPLKEQKELLELDLADLMKTYPHTPATIQLADPKDPNADCGFLLLAVEHVNNVLKVDARYKDAIPKAVSTGKWPRGNGTLVALLTEILGTERAKTLSCDERAKLEVFIKAIA